MAVPRGTRFYLALCLQPLAKTETPVGPSACLEGNEKTRADILRRRSPNHGEVWEQLPSATAQINAHFLLTFDVNVGAVVLDVVARPQAHCVNALMLLVRRPNSDGGAGAAGLQVHGGGRKQLDA